MNRRDFIQTSLVAGTSALAFGNTFNLFARPAQTVHAVKVTGSEPAAMVKAAFSAFGGIGAFISKGDVVVIKPNIGWDRAPEFAATTNPELVAAVIKACLNAGASKVKVFDRTCNNPQRCYRNSRIEKAAKEAGAEVEQVRQHKFKSFSLPGGEILKEWPLYQDYLDADKTINIPIAKHHSLSRVTLGLKNLMGVMGGNRGEIHNNFDTKLIDVDSHILPTFSIVDAQRILLRNGPVGGNLNDVKAANTLIMSPCIVTADYLALELFNLELDLVSHIKSAYKRGLHKFDPNSLTVKKVDLS